MGIPRLEEKDMNIAIFASGNGSNFNNLIELKKINYLKPEIKLLITDRDCRAMELAKTNNIENIKIDRNLKENEISDYLIKILKERNIDLIVLAGYLSKLPDDFTKKYYGKIINIHPSILPSFGGKGFYGEKVHKAVIQKGVKISGITIHFVDSVYDNGPIIFQKSINLYDYDTPETSAQKIHSIEHFYYPFVINMISENIIALDKGKVIIRDIKPTSKHALISLSYKTGIIEFAKELNKRGYLIISTGNTYRTLVTNGIRAASVESVSGFEEILDGRVKTLNNIIFGGILATGDKKHIKQINENFIPKIEIVVSNLYPFKEAAEKYHPFEKELIENIDIGGVSLIRAAAKNYKDVIIITDNGDFNKVLENPDSEDLRKELSIKAFRHTYNYDKMIYEKLSGYNEMEIKLKKVFNLRYGENPHQKSALYTQKDELPFIQLWGKELSYNNILDAYGSWQAAGDFEEPTCVIFKHVTPCGIARDLDITKAFEHAYSTDPLSAFGGVISLNRKVTREIAEYLSSKFVEIISAPEYEEEAIEIFKKKKNLRIIKWNKDTKDSKIYKSVGDEMLISDPDNIIISDKWEVVSGEISEREKKALLFAFACVKHIRSNAIVLTTDSATIGIGAGQMSRVDSVKMAEYKFSEYLKNNPKPDLIVMGSDAFFPFADSIIKAKEIGVSAIIQPGGSIRDKEVIEKARELGIKMVLTGIRHFRH